MREANLKIYDISGKLIWEETKFYLVLKKILQYFVSNVPNSILFLKLH